MKILHLLGWYFPDSIGGTETYVAALARQQKRSGHQVLVAAPTTDPIGCATYQHDGVNVFRYSIPSEPARLEAGGAVPVRGAEVLHEWMAAERPSIVHVHSLVTGVSLHEIAAAKKAGAAVVFTNHLPSLGFLCQRGNLMEWGTHPCDGIVTLRRCAACTLEKYGVPSRLASWLAAIPAPVSDSMPEASAATKLGSALGMQRRIAWARAMQGRLFESVDAVVVLNRWAYDCLIANGALQSKLHVNRLGVGFDVDRAAIESRSTNTPPSIGYIGRLDPDKGLLELAAAFNALPADAAIRLRFVGPTNGDRAVVSVLRGLVGADPRVTIEPPVSPAEVPALLRSIDVLCCPSSGFENGPTIALEAMAVGTPVIGSRIGGLREIVRDGIDGALVAPKDVQALSRVLRRVVEDPRTVGEWRKAIAPVRTMRVVGEDYERLYTRITEHEHRPVCAAG